MATRSPTSAMEDAANTTAVIEGFQRALDKNYQRLLEVARSDWQRQFGGTEPSDACVSVRIRSAEITTQKRTVARSGFLPASRRTSSPNGKRCKHFA
jgi:hypothetical protein